MEETTVEVVGVLLHLLMPQKQVREEIDVSDALQTSSMLSCQMDDDSLDRLALDELEELQAGRVEEIIPWHGFVDEIDDGLEDVILDELVVVEIVLAAQA